MPDSVSLQLSATKQMNKHTIPGCNDSKQLAAALLRPELNSAACTLMGRARRMAEGWGTRVRARVVQPRRRDSRCALSFSHTHTEAAAGAAQAEPATAWRKHISRQGGFRVGRRGASTRMCLSPVFRGGAQAAAMHAGDRVRQGILLAQQAASARSRQAPSLSTRAVRDVCQSNSATDMARGTVAWCCGRASHTKDIVGDYFLAGILMVQLSTCKRLARALRCTIPHVRIQTVAPAFFSKRRYPPPPSGAAPGARTRRSTPRHPKGTQQQQPSTAQATPRTPARAGAPPCHPPDFRHLRVLNSKVQ